MALYPSLEDMKIDQLMKAQSEVQNSGRASLAPFGLSNNTPYPLTPSAPLIYETSQPAPNAPVYPSLGEYMGLELSHDVIAANMPEYLQAPSNTALVTRPNYAVEPVNKIGALVAPLSGQSEGLKKGFVTNGVREVILCKNAEGKIGLRVQHINSGIFVSLVTKDSPAAQVGLRFGDQILQINGSNVAGYTMDKVHDIFKKCPVNGISVVVRDRPFERTVTLHKDSAGKIGFSFKDGKIINLVLDSSAARNGVLTDHNLLEVNGQNVIGLKDKEITKIIAEGGNIITVTIIPSFIYQHMTKSMSSSLIKGSMDHSIPAF
ncbi:UNVERIFIED_CONTAM: hypothetical protein PYX00_005430 [Menopon gallinae]|uniref:PDZ domain-containing protein n=1 Tax=Menopon gallinae TaxID=328185 RepID=A0AAW2HS53_9NEOP